MRLVLLGVALVFVSAACEPARDPSATSANKEDGAGEAKDGDEDEVAEDREIMADTSLDPAFRSVKVMQTSNIGCPMEVMGLVDVHMPVKSEDQALEVLARKAVKLGALAVVNVEFHHGEPGEEPTHLSGLAVRCNDLIKGRTYDVLANLDVTAEMGKEDDGDRELRRRARALGANLVINVTFEHGDGEGRPTHVRGTAIRFRK